MKTLPSLALILISISGWARPASLETRIEDRRDLSVTAYNNGLALVRDLRAVSLPTGEVTLTFSDVASRIRSETVSLRSIRRPDSLRVLEQNYEYDLLSPHKLLEKYVGRTVRLVNFHQSLGFESVEAELLSLNKGPVYRIGDEIFLGHPGNVSVPEVPDNLIATPSLVWNLDTDLSDQELEVTYLTEGIAWKADYVVTLDRNDRDMDMDGWVTLTNQSGMDYENARLKLVAGDVNRVLDGSRHTERFQELEALGYLADGGLSQEIFAEYHLYALPRRTTIRQNQSKQVALLGANSIRADKIYEYRGRARYYSQAVPALEGEHVAVFLKFRNEEGNRLGIPLPAGIMRVYQEDSDGILQFAGEDSIEHTPKNETVKLRMGNAFDVVGERVQADYERIASNVHESRFRITLRNHKEHDIVVDVIEPFSGDWRLLDSSIEFEIRDARSAVFSVPVEAGGETTFTYHVRVRY